MRFEYDTYDIDVYSLCESVYYSCNNDEYDYVLECVNNWIYNDYNDNILLEDIILNETTGYDKLITYLARDFAKRFPNKTEEDFFQMIERAPGRRYSPDTNRWKDISKYDTVNYGGNKRLYDYNKLHSLLRDLSDREIENKFKALDPLNPYEKNSGINLISFYRQYIARAMNKHEGYWLLQKNHPEMFLPDGKVIVDKTKFKDPLEFDTIRRRLYDDSIPTRNEEEWAADHENSPIKVKTVKRNRNALQKRHLDLASKFGTIISPDHNTQQQTQPNTPPQSEQRSSSDSLRNNQGKPAQTPPKQDTSSTPPKSNPVLLNAQKKKDESQANMQKIVDNISQTPSQQKLPLISGTTATPQPQKKVETKTQQQTQPNTPLPPPKSNTPLEDKKGKPAQTPPKQDTSSTPPKSNPVLLNAQKKKDESQANMQKIVDNISQTPSQQEPALTSGTAATPQPDRKVETKTQQQQTQPNTPPPPPKSNTPLEDKKGKPAQTPPKQDTPPTPPKFNTPVVTSNDNNQSRLSRATTWMKNNKVKGGLGVVAAGAAIGGSIYAYKRFKNRPKSVIAKRIQALRGIYHKFMINAQRNPHKANLFKRVAAKILSVIDKLLHYLQNKADGR